MDRQQFERTVAVYRRDFHALALKILGNSDDAEDVAQETLLRLWDIADRLGDYTSVKSLGMLVTRNKCIDRIRAARPTAPLDEADGPDDEAPPPDHRLIEADAERTRNRLLDQLPEMQRRVITLRHVEGLDTPEIAEITGQREDAVRVTLSRARRRLKELFLNQRNLNK